MTSPAEHVERLRGILETWAAYEGGEPEIEADLAALSAAIEAMEKESATQTIVDRQAEDSGLWFKAETAAEAYLQQELRALHKAIEGKSAKQCAEETLLYRVSQAEAEVLKICDVSQLQSRVAVLEGALEGLLDACEAHNTANDRQMIDPHAEATARAALPEKEQGDG